MEYNQSTIGDEKSLAQDLLDIDGNPNKEKIS